MTARKMDSKHLKAAYDRDGFVVVREFLSGRALEELRGNIDRYIKEIVPGLPATSAFYHDPQRPETLKQLQHMAVDPFFADYIHHPDWCQLAAGIVGEEVKAKGAEWFNKPAGTEHPTPPHQDNFYFCLRPANVATLWLALDRVDESNGCLRYVRGSHLQGIRPHETTKVLGFSQGITDFGPADEARQEMMILEPGDLIAHHGETIHFADANRSQRQRRAFAIVFQGLSCQRDEAAYDRYMTSVRQQQTEFGIAQTDDSTA